MKVRSSEIIGHQLVESVFALLRRERLHDRQTLRVRDVGRDLPAKRAVADRLEPGLERLEDLVPVEVDGDPTRPTGRPGSRDRE